MSNRAQILDFFRCQRGSSNPGIASLMRPDSRFVQILDVPICERPTQSTGYDVFGVHWSFAQPASHYTHGQAPIISDIYDWREELKLPSIGRFDWDYVTAQGAALDREDKISVATLLMGPFERTTSLSSFEDCLMNLISEPEEFSDLIGALADYRIQVIHRLAAAAKPDILNIHDDWGTSLSTFMSPQLWREVIRPHTKRIYDAIHSHGILVCQHSCGAIGALVGDMVEMGCDIWEGQPECNDYDAIRAEFGDRLCLFTKPSPGEIQRLEQAGWLSRMACRSDMGYDAKPGFLYD